MPRPVWKHDCCDAGVLFAIKPECQHCGASGTLAWIELSIQERERRFELVFALKPMGDLWNTVQHEFTAMRKYCERCNGTGVQGASPECVECRLCEGSGGIWAVDEATLATAYRNVLKQYPDYRAFGALSRPIRSLHEPTRSTVRAKRLPTTKVWKPAYRVPKPVRTWPKKALPKHGRPLTEVQLAFLAAEEKLGRKWQLKGRGHCRRASINRGHARAVHAVVSCCARLHGAGMRWPAYVLPLPIIEEAARTLGVDVDSLNGREF